MTQSIPLSRGLFALVDDNDFAWLSQWKWCAMKTKTGRFYAVRGGNTVMMHREILKPAPGFHSDHIDNDGLNNQRSNLRPVTRCQNAQNAPAKSCNSTGYKGVSHYGKRFLAQIMANRVPVKLGVFDTAEQAHAAYVAAALTLHGEYARVA